jgi:hypothetical protein
MMQIVPENKTVYIGARRFVEGDVLPPFVRINIPVAKIEKEEKPKRNYRSRRGSISKIEEE